MLEYNGAVVMAVAFTAAVVLVAFVDADVDDDRPGRGRLMCTDGLVTDPIPAEPNPIGDGDIPPPPPIANAARLSFDPCEFVEEEMAILGFIKGDIGDNGDMLRRL